MPREEIDEATIEGLLTEQYDDQLRQVIITMKSSVTDGDASPDASLAALLEYRDRLTAAQKLYTMAVEMAKMSPPLKELVAALWEETNWSRINAACERMSDNVFARSKRVIDEGRS